MDGVGGCDGWIDDFVYPDLANDNMVHHGRGYFGNDGLSNAGKCNYRNFDDLPEIH
jgi:hypothetical protein